MLIGCFNLSPVYSQDKNDNYPEPCTHYLGKFLLNNIYIGVNSLGKLSFLPNLPDILNPLKFLNKKKKKEYGLDKLSVLFKKFSKLEISKQKPFFKQVIEIFDVKFNPKNSFNIPKKGPTVFYSNHPLSGVDGLAIAAEIEKYRSDVKLVMMNLMTQSFEGKEGHLIPVYPKRGWLTGKKVNKNVISAMNEHVKNGGALLIFPAGKVSRRSIEGSRVVKDSPWSKSLIRVGENSENTKFVPIFVEGQPGEGFLKAIDNNDINEANIRVLEEMSRQIGGSLNFVFGKQIALSALTKLESYQNKVLYLRAKLYSMGKDFFYTKYSPEDVIHNSSNPYLTKEEFAIYNSSESDGI